MLKFKKVIRCNSMKCLLLYIVEVDKGTIMWFNLIGSIWNLIRKMNGTKTILFQVMGIMTHRGIMKNEGYKGNISHIN